MKNRRRRKGEGGLRFREDLKLWEICITLGKDPVTGKQRRITRTARTEVEAQKLKTSLLFEHNMGLLIESNNISLGQLLEQWFKTFRLPGQYENTRRATLGLIRNHILPNIGDIQINKLSSMQLQAFLNHLGQPGANRQNLFHKPRPNKALSLSVRKRIRSLLISVFEYAKGENIIRKNPAKQTTLPKSTSKPNTAYFDSKQIQSFLGAAVNSRYYLAFVLLFATGMRRSELLGLSWKSVDLKNMHITVEQSLIEFGNFIALRPHPKTAAGWRSIPITQELAEMLKAHKQKQELENVENEHGLVFTTTTGDWVKPNNFTKTVKEFVAKANLPKNLGTHAARRTYATMTLASGIPTRDVMLLGGWSDIQTLFASYVKGISVEQERASAVMSQFIFSVNSKEPSSPKDTKNEPATTAIATGSILGPMPAPTYQSVTNSRTANMT